MARYSTFTRGAFLVDNSTKLLGQGTTGSVYELPGTPTLCVKIYTAEHRQAHAPKVAAMIQNPPEGTTAGGRVQAAWPIEAVEDEAGEPVGLIMPAVNFDNTISLSEALNLASQDKIPRRRLVAIAANLAGMVANLNRAGHFVIDFNPQNFRVSKNDGFIAFIDCDGYRIKTPGSTSHFYAEVAQPEYILPGAILSDGSFSREKINVSAQDQDSWAVALSTFRLLNRGLFAYDGIPQSGMAGRIPAENILRARICRDLYPYGPRPSLLLLPPPYSLHDLLPEDLREAFDRTFQDGVFSDAAHWRAMLEPLATGSRQCPHDSSHWRLGSTCELCARPLARPPPPPPPINPPPAPGPAPTAAPIPSPKPRPPSRFQRIAKFGSLAAFGLLGVNLLFGERGAFEFRSPNCEYSSEYDWGWIKELTGKKTQVYVNGELTISICAAKGVNVSDIALASADAFPLKLSIDSAYAKSYPAILAAFNAGEIARIATIDHGHGGIEYRLRIDEARVRELGARHIVLKLIPISGMSQMQGDSTQPTGAATEAPAKQGPIGQAAARDGQEPDRQRSVDPRPAAQIGEAPPPPPATRQPEPKFDVLPTDAAESNRAEAGQPTSPRDTNALDFGLSPAGANNIAR